MEVTLENSLVYSQCSPMRGLRDTHLFYKYVHDGSVFGAKCLQLLLSYMSLNLNHRLEANTHGTVIIKDEEMEPESLQLSLYVRT